MITAKPRVLVLDDEPDLRTLYELALIGQGYEVDLAGDLQEARQLLKHESFDVLISDMRLPDGLGLELVQQIAQERRSERCIVITAYGSAENAVNALKAGAFDYLTKPVDVQRLRDVVAQALAVAPLAQSIAPGMSSARKGAGELGPSSPTKPPAAATISEALNEPSAYALSQIVGGSAAVRDLKAKVLKVAKSMAPVSVVGESGTGKELVARALHACSHRAAGPFVPVNCAAIPENLLEAEFFGARKGAYTGASADRSGYFEQANGGTLFLDEIGDLPLAMQSKLLRAIQERQVRALGAATEMAVDVRIVSATHRDLAAAVAAGRFRQDLYYRINVIELGLPPLRERKADLPELCDALLARIVGRPVGAVRLSAESLAALARLDMPGNVRELENILHRAWALAEPDEAELSLRLGFDTNPETPHAGAECLSAANQEAQQNLGQAANASEWRQGASGLPSDLTAYLDAQERAILLHALQQHQFNRTAAAQQLGISLRQIRYRIARLGIELPAAAAASEE